MKNKLINQFLIGAILFVLVICNSVLAQSNSYTLQRLSDSDTTISPYSNIVSFRFNIDNSQNIVLEVFKFTSDSSTKLVSFDFKNLAAGRYILVWDNVPQDLKGNFLYQVKLDGVVTEKHIFRIE